MSNHTHTAPDEPFELEPLDTPRHTQIGLWLSFRSDLSPTARQLYVIMAGFVNHHRRTQGDTSAWPSLEMLAILLTLSRGDKVTPYMDELIWIGAVAKRTRHTQGGMRSRNIYGIRFNPPPGSGMAEGIDEILEPHRKVMRETNSKGLAEYMSTRAKATKEEIKRRRAQAKASRTSKTQTCPTTPPGQGFDQDNPYPPKQGYGPTSANEETPGQPVPPDSGVRTPENRGSVPPKTGVELYEGRTTRRGENLPHSSPPSSEAVADSVSDDGGAVADALSNGEWSTDDVANALPDSAKATGPGLERIAARCTELSGWGLSADEIGKLLAGAPKNNPDKALLQRTATPEDARKTLAGSNEDGREDVDRVCDHLADTVAQLGFTRPSEATVRSKSWRRAARMMIDSDHAPSVDEHGNPISKKITEDAIIRMIDWVAQDEFWGSKGNIRSMPKLRKQFETLAAQARQRHAQRTGSAGGGGYRPKHVKDEEIERYAGTLEMSLDYVLGIDDPEYRKDLADARVSGGDEGVVAFRERVFGPRSGWSVRVTREHLMDLFARVRDAGYRLDEDVSHTRPLKKSWAESLAQEEGALPEELDAFRQRSEAEEAERVRAKQKAAGAALLAQLGYGPPPEVEAGTA